MTPDGVLSVCTPTERELVAKKIDPVGLKEIAAMAGVSGERGGTVYIWRSRGTLPAEDRMVSGNPVWDRKVIEKWLVDTGRVKAETEEPVG
jgi:hypothetical protein